MLRTLIIAPDVDLSRRLRNALDDSGQVTAAQEIHRYPELRQLSHILRVQRPHIVFLGTDSLDSCAESAAHIQSMMPGLPVVAVGRRCKAEAVMAVMETGMPEFLGMPFEPSVVSACLERVPANRPSRNFSRGRSRCRAAHPSFHAGRVWSEGKKPC